MDRDPETGQREIAGDFWAVSRLEQSGLNSLCMETPCFWQGSDRIQSVPLAGWGGSLGPGGSL